MGIGGYFKQRKWFWIITVSLVAVINFLKYFPVNLQENYSDKFYKIISLTLRGLFGWIPFSMGDVLYFAAGCWLLILSFKFFRLLLRKKLKSRLLLVKILRLFSIAIVMYISFNVLWGLNYDGMAVASKLGLAKVKWDTSVIVHMQGILIKQVNANKQALLKSEDVYPSNSELFLRAAKSFDKASSIYPFLDYKIRSVKSSFYSTIGNYLGFTGYYNPFSGEAQVNTTVPKFLLPFITNHEIAHQLGYAKEDEANFVSYLASVNSGDTLFKYSAYLDLFMYANREIYYFDTALAQRAIDSLIGPVRADLAEWRKFSLEHTSFLEPAISWMYGKYLKLHHQPEGLRSYNKVIEMLAAYYKKYGRI